MVAKNAEEEIDYSPAKAQRRQVQKGNFLNFCALATLREIFRNSVAALPRMSFVVNKFLSN